MLKLDLLIKGLEILSDTGLTVDESEDTLFNMGCLGNPSLMMKREDFTEGYVFDYHKYCYRVFNIPHLEHARLYDWIFDAEHSSNIENIIARVTQARNLLNGDFRDLTEEESNQLKYPKEYVNNLKVVDPDPDLEATIDSLVMKKKLDKLEERNQSLTALLESAHAIAKRKGVDTAWGRFIKSCEELSISPYTARHYKLAPTEVEVGSKETI